MQCLTEIPICAIQGDDEAYQLTFTTDGTTPVDLTGSTVKFVLVPAKDTPDAQAIVTKTISTFAAPLTGVADLSLTNIDTNQPLGTYFYRLKLISPSAKVKTIMKGTFSIQWAK